MLQLYASRSFEFNLDLTQTLKDELFNPSYIYLGSIRCLGQSYDFVLVHEEHPTLLVHMSCSLFLK